MNKMRIYANFDIDMDTIDKRFAAVVEAKEKLATAVIEFEHAVASCESGVVLSGVVAKHS